MTKSIKIQQLESGHKYFEIYEVRVQKYDGSVITYERYLNKKEAEEALEFVHEVHSYLYKSAWIRIKWYGVNQSVGGNPYHLKTTKTMKAIKIKVQGIVKTHYSVIARQVNDLCYVSEKAIKFIKTNSLDGKIYDIFGYECERMFAGENGHPMRFYIKGAVYDENNFIPTPKEGEYMKKLIELEVIDIMD